SQPIFSRCFCAAPTTSVGVRCVRSISRTDCCAKIGAKFVFATAATWPGVARPRRSPKPNDFLSPRTEGFGVMGLDQDLEGRGHVTYFNADSTIFRNSASADFTSASGPVIFTTTLPVLLSTM